MAGFYPDVPNHRFAWDQDGSVGVFIDFSNGVTQMTSTQMENFNNESADWISISSYSKFGVVFPEPRDFTHYFVIGDFNGNLLEVSADTTNGVDGTWTTVANPYVRSTVIKPGYRDSIQAVAGATDVTGLRFTRGGSNNRLQGFHIYGNLTASSLTDRLKIWDPVLDQEATPAHLDWGDVARSTTADKTFRIKNSSSTLTASSIDITSEALSDTSPSLPPQFTLSDGGAFASSINIGDLGPGALSPVITVRRTTPSNATLSIWSLRINAEPGSWS